MSVVGIHFGIKNSIAAIKKEKIEIVTAFDNIPPERKLTPSVVGLKQDRLVVGQEALHQQKADPENVIVGIRNLLGRNFDDSVIQQQLNQFAYKITKSTKGTENSLSVWLRGKEYEPEDISAEYYQKISAKCRCLSRTARTNRSSYSSNYNYSCLL